ncbi:transcriptional regulator, LysR family [Pseudomonas asplenii]|uniref:Transcriptional regulator, LysR family n=1 Tax=Pseudomonas asplenii TaxID=53407 RepID=A0A0N0E608_9PSED|nr:LysR family transcriptional regulator [Pseudomonas fuscovaginae]KPA93091.1 transcriptional regulator, LysR family [Pseudomonas fuscovaginae]
MNKLELLRTFIRVTELSSFTQASESLGLPRSSVSEHVQTLEDLLGTRLLQRTTRKVQATQDGLVLYERSKELLSQVDELEGLFRQDASLLGGRIRFDMPSAMARRVVMPRLPEFMARHPRIELEISSTDRRVDLLSEGFDCVLRVGAQPDQTVVARPVSSLPVVNCASPAYLQRHGMPSSPEDLVGHRLIHYVGVLGSRSSGFEYLHDGKLIQVPMAGSVTVNGIDCYEGACLGGLGLIQAPLLGMARHLERGDLIEVLPGFRPAPLDVSLLYAGQRHLPRRVRVFMDWLVQVLHDACEGVKRQTPP